MVESAEGVLGAKRYFGTVEINKVVECLFRNERIYPDDASNLDSYLVVKKQFLAGDIMMLSDGLKLMNNDNDMMPPVVPVYTIVRSGGAYDKYSDNLHKFIYRDSGYGRKIRSILYAKYTMQKSMLFTDEKFNDSKISWFDLNNGIFITLNFATQYELFWALSASQAEMRKYKQN